MTYNYSLFWSKIIWTIFFLIAPLSIYLALNNYNIILEWTILKINSTNVTLPILLDPFSSLFSSTVLLISANVLIFSATYIQEDPFIKRFTQLVLAFILSINILLFFPHIITLLLGWDGLGITSFLLIIYYQNPKSLAAGIITGLTNRIGDVLLLLSIAWTISQGHWLINNIWNNNLQIYIILAITIAAITKRAQIPFSSWLPAAIAAPTPVSALVHSSTLVTAGVFLIIRFHYFLSSIKLFNIILLFTASATILIAGISAIVEIDLKKIIALSTLSQLGVIIAALSINIPKIAFFHLVTHATFKALLFICAGRIINYNHHSQDIRSIGSLIQQIPVTTSCLITANLALIGTPFLAGFYSKDLILEISISTPINILILLIFILATILTAIYSARLIIITLWSSYNSLPLNNLNNKTNALTTPTIILSIAAITCGRALNWIFIIPFSHPTLTTLNLNYPLLISWFGVRLVIIYSTINIRFPLLIPKLSTFLSLIWFITPLSTQNIITTPLHTGQIILKLTDNGWNEILGGKGLHSLFSFSRSSIQRRQSKNINIQLLTSIIILTTLTLIIIK